MHAKRAPLQLASSPGSSWVPAAATRAVARTRRMPVTVPITGLPVHGAQQQQQHLHGAVPAAALPSDALARLSAGEQQQLISDSIRVIPDFPKPGIMFQDVTSLLLNPAAFQATVNLLAARYAGQRIDAIAGTCCWRGRAAAAAAEMQSGHGWGTAVSRLAVQSGDSAVE